MVARLSGLKSRPAWILLLSAAIKMAVGLVPMGGSAARWQPLVSPKELLPFGNRPDGSPKVAADCVFDAMTAGDVSRVIVPILPQKAQLIMRYLGTRLKNGALITYFAAPGPTLTANVMACVPLLGNDDVFFGMPDTSFTPADIFLHCGARLSGQAECVLGVFPSDSPAELDVVLHRDGIAESVWPKPHGFGSAPGDVWGVAAWNAAFTRRVASWPDACDPLGAIFRQAAAEGRGSCAVVAGQDYADLGTYSRYAHALAGLHVEAAASVRYTGPGT
jgi:Nucleoside-diphosphate-sugar pyrophosphorylase involved in lipopolysaccharide biosynthesis/translation initiation factor 2B, gamma/epsilon subunits (eIF-2Bgamma/eIF-2Bepsilon)